MTQAKIIGGFKLGGAEWTILFDEDTSENNDRYEYNVSECKLIINGYFNGRLYSNQALQKNLWQAIFRLITCDMMYLSEDITKPIAVSYSGMITQALNTLIITDWDGMFQLGCIEYFVTPDSERCHRDNFFGCHYPVEKKILLRVESLSKEKLPEGSIWQTFFHELLHAISSELGYDNTDLNSEKFVNVLSLFLYEVNSTLVFNIPEL